MRKVTLSLTMALLGLGCGDGCQKDPGSDISDAGTAATFMDAGDAGENAAELREPLTAENVSPVIQTVGPSAEVPKKLSVEFARNVIENGPRSLGADTALTITPEVQGSYLSLIHI